MGLLNNTIVFLDTGFFKNFTKPDQYKSDLFEYSKTGKIILCTSFICIEEWRHQKLIRLRDYLNERVKKYDFLRKDDFLAEEVLCNYPLEGPSYTEIEEVSRSVINEFLTSNNIVQYLPIEGHIDRTWRAYFSGSAPFEEAKNRTDIPDSWVFEAAKDVVADDKYAKLEHRYCIGGDINLIKHLKAIGLEEIKAIDLIKLLKSEEESEKSGVETESKPISSSILLPRSGKSEVAGFKSLEDVLNSALSEEIALAYLKILGYIDWLNGPSKHQLITTVASTGLNPDLISACAIMLAHESLNLISDTGNYYLPINRDICAAAGGLIMPEILEKLKAE